MAVLTSSLLTILLTLFVTNANAMTNDHSLPPLPKLPTLRKPEPSAPIAHNRDKLKKAPLFRTKTPYSFGTTAANSLEEAMRLGFVKNEHPYKPDTPLVSSLNVGHCVIIPRSDQRFSYGFITEVMNPNMVCVACDKRKDKNDTSDNNDNYTIKIIATNKLFIDPTWLNHNQEDNSTLAHYRKSMQHATPLPENLQEEDSYERLPKIETKNIAKK